MADLPLGRYMFTRQVGDGWLVLDRDGGTLARIEWYPRWRCYVLSLKRRPACGHCRI